MQFIISVVFAIALSIPAWAKKSSTRLPSSNAQEIVHMVVYYGEKTTEFTIGTDKGKSVASFVSNMDSHRQKELSSNDVNYVVSQLKQVASKLEASGACSRQSMFVKFTLPGGTTYESSACIGANTLTAKKLMQVANLFAAMF